MNKYGDVETDIRTKGMISFPILKGRTIQLKLRSIIRLESEGTLTKAYLRKNPKQPIWINITIKECEVLLNNEGFFRIHRQHLINLDAVDFHGNLSKDSVKLFTEEILPVARRRYAEFFSEFRTFRKVRLSEKELNNLSV